MKQCPQCHNIYTDDATRFCLVDGAALRPATQPDFRRDTAPPTEVLPAYVPPPVSPPGVTKIPVWVAAALGGVVLILCGVVATLWFTRTPPDNTARSPENVGPNPAARSQPPDNPVAKPASRDNPASKPEVRDNPGGPPPAPKPSATVEGKMVLPTPTPPPNLPGVWRGAWHGGPATSNFSAELRLEPTGGNGVAGTITWTLQSSPHPAKQAKAGAVATEYVRGAYDPATGMVTLTGYRKDDPDNVIRLDSYRLQLGGNSLSGATRNNGSWNGRLSLNR